MNVHEGQSNACGECGSRDLRWERTDTEVPFRDRVGNRQVAIANVPKGTCIGCGAIVFPHEALVLQHEAVCRSLGVLTPREIVGGRKRLALSQEQFADLTSFGVASIRRWERGASIQSNSSDQHLRTVLNRQDAGPAAQATPSEGFRFKPRSAAMRKLFESQRGSTQHTNNAPTKFPSFQEHLQVQEHS